MCAEGKITNLRNYLLGKLRVCVFFLVHMVMRKSSLRSTIMQTSNETRLRRFAGFRRYVTFILYLLMTVSSGIFEMAYAQGSFPMDMFDKKLDVKIMELSANRIGTVPNARRLFHDADRILIAPAMGMTLVSRNTNVYILQRNEAGEIISLEVNICELIPWICAYVPQQISPFGR